MASKRRSASSSKVGAKKEEPEETPKEALKAAGPEEKLTRKLDEQYQGIMASPGPEDTLTGMFKEQCNVTAAEVYKDYDCMLNQTNIQDNRNINKFWAIQVIKEDSSYLCWWTSGRVEFEEKFKAKTKNNWANRHKFVTHGEFTLIELDRKTAFRVDGTTKNVLPVNLDIEKMPLGKLSKRQIDKGFNVLEGIEAALELDQTPAEHEKLSSRFYSTIPHNFGNSRPPVIDNKNFIDQKKVLADIEFAQTLKSETSETKN
ncbi:hypothetical protein NHX12_030978 [Muraenolepis orangiensis]|uniref:Uncharacterized protein n=1 Tax=Muraenolepis orangiensis TaxID=630683 RepID=A0A9Q0INE0_9TELE|nr:hypothetical protein NHX12_030978 [Muraenolepis orangiensis]